MPSQDDYLDELLKGMSQEEDVNGLYENRGLDTPDMDALSEMTEEQISALLSAGTGKNTGGESIGRSLPSREDHVPESDVLDILEGTKDHDLREIQDMLEKSDRNEAIEGSMQYRSGREENPADRLLADIEEAGENKVAGDVTDAKSQRASKKEERRQEKAAKKEAKKMAKQAAREKKTGKRNSGTKQEAEETFAEAEITPRKADSSAVQEYDIMMDKNLLDSIVSGAGRAGKEREEEKKVFTESASPAVEESAGGIGDLLSYAKADLDSAENPEAEWSQNERRAPELDIMALDMSEIDAFISEKPSQGDEKGKKEGFLKKMISFLMEEDEPEAENEDVKLSEENEEILKDLDNEKPKKGSKAKKAKKKEPAKKEKKAKPKKPPKPKKEKKPAEVDLYPPGKRLTLKKAMPLIVFGISLVIVIILFVNLSVDYKDKQEAKAAYKAGDYESCYSNLFGKKLSDEEAIMYGRSESILYIRLWYREYEMLAEQGSEVKALDSLIQTVVDYPQLYAYAAQWNAGMDVYEIYLDILDTLYSKYGVTEAQAQEIAAVKSDLEYTRIVTALAEGKEYGSWNKAPEVPQEPVTNEPEAGSSQEDLPDELPEEAEIDTGDFIE